MSIATLNFFDTGANASSREGNIFGEIVLRSGLILNVCSDIMFMPERCAAQTSAPFRNVTKNSDIFPINMTFARSEERYNRGVRERP